MSKYAVHSFNRFGAIKIQQPMDTDTQSQLLDMIELFYYNPSL